MSVALIVIYNHRYDRNIPVVENIYRDRFSDIYHVVPFYDGDRPNVIPVYEHSFYFQGYIAQAARFFVKAQYDHYFFVADDMVLNPEVNEHNYRTYLRLDEQSSYISAFLTLHEVQASWPWTQRAYAYQMKKRGVEVEKEIPSYDEALAKFRKFGLTIEPLAFDKLYPAKWHMSPGGMISFLKNRIVKYRYRFHGKKLELVYPLVGAYSDIFVVSAQAIKKFCHYCGVFAATELFVEIAIPTALVLSSEKIVLEQDVRLQGMAMWTEEDRMIVAKYNNNLQALLADFPPNFLYLHPIKLSQWKT
jgi:hypothetical protein